MPSRFTVLVGRRRRVGKTQYVSGPFKNFKQKKKKLHVNPGSHSRPRLGRTSKFTPDPSTQCTLKYNIRITRTTLSCYAVPRRIPRTFSVSPSPHLLPAWAKRRVSKYLNVFRKRLPIGLFDRPSKVSFASRTTDRGRVSRRFSRVLESAKRRGPTPFAWTSVRRQPII